MFAESIARPPIRPMSCVRVAGPTLALSSEFAPRLRSPDLPALCSRSLSVVSYLPVLCSRTRPERLFPRMSAHAYP